MTNTALKNALFGANPVSTVNPAQKAAANTQKAAGFTAGKAQDFGAVLDKTAQKYEQKSEKPVQTASDDSAKAQKQQPEQTTVDTQTAATTVDTQKNAASEDTDAAVNEQTAQAALDGEDAETTTNIADTASSVKDVIEEFTGELLELDQPVDEMTVDEITRVLEQIIEQMKEILGVTDVELFDSMEELGLQSYDLLNVDHMSQLVTAISGENSLISLVANEDLYTALQDITELVDTQVNNLLDHTELTDEELDVVLQKLQKMTKEDGEVPFSKTAEDVVVDQPVGKEETIAVEKPIRTDQPVAADQPIVAERPVVKEETITAEKDVATEEPVAEEVLITAEEKAVADQPVVKEPIVVKEDNTKSDAQPTKQYDTLPENQQENPTEVVTKPQTQNTGKDTKDSDNSDKDSKNFGQQSSTAQNLQNHFNELNDVAATEGIEKFTSESTENILRQLADMVKIIKNENLTEMELQLHPASLGTVNVSLTTKGGVVTAEFTTQNETVKAAIEAQASQLRANLEEQGVKVEAIEVSVESHQMERNLDKNGDQQQRQSQEQETMRVQGMRRGRSSINLRAFTDGESIEGEMQGADDATRIAMEIMAANGNTMDLLV